MNICFLNGVMLVFGVSIVNINMFGLCDFEMVGVGVCYVIVVGFVWVNWMYMKFMLLLGELLKLNYYEIGGCYVFLLVLSGGFGYMFLKFDGCYDGKWYQVNVVVDYVLLKCIDVYVSVVYQKVLGSNMINGWVVLVQVEIGLLLLFVGSVGVNMQFVMWIGLCYKF